MERGPGRTCTSEPFTYCLQKIHHSSRNFHTFSLFIHELSMATKTPHLPSGVNYGRSKRQVELWYLRIHQAPDFSRKANFMRFLRWCDVTGAVATIHSMISPFLVIKSFESIVGICWNHYPKWRPPNSMPLFRQHDLCPFQTSTVMKATLMGRAADCSSVDGLPGQDKAPPKEFRNNFVKAS